MGREKIRARAPASTVPRKTAVERAVITDSVRAASIRPYWTTPATGTAPRWSASAISAGVALGFADTARAARPATRGVADEVPQKISSLPPRIGATLQPGAEKRTHAP